MGASPNVPGANEIKDAAFSSFAGNLLTLRTPDPLPPGSRVELFLAVPGVAEPMQIKGKVSSVRGKNEVGFALEVRVHSLTKEQRLRLEAAAEFARQPGSR